MNKVKSLVQQLSITKDGKLCTECRNLNEITELKRVIRERVFDVSNEGETTLNNDNIGLEMSFNKEESWKSKTKIIQTRG